MLIDDAGYGQLGTFGGGIPTPTMDRIAKNGLRYTHFHTTALCSPTRAALLTGRNHHSVASGVIGEAGTGFPGYSGLIPASAATFAEVRREYGSPYHFTTDIADKAIRMMRASKAVAPQRPFFVYFATGATHALHQVPKAWIDKFAGQFDDGWDAYREKTLKRQIDLGVVPKETKLTKRPDSLPANEKKVYARMMEVFACFTAHTAHEVGRLIDAIDEMGELDNTLVIYMAGDNGSSAEGSLSGLLNEMTFFNAIPEPLDAKLAAIDTLGSDRHYNHFPAAWAHAMDTPFQYYNLAGVERFTIESKDRIPTGEVTLKATYVSDADKPFAGANVTLYANDEKLAEGRVEKSIPNRVTLDETLDVGFDTGTPVMEGYDMPFDFSGKLNAVTIELN